MDVEYMVMRKTDGKWSSPVCFTLPADEAGDDERVSIKRRAEQRVRVEVELAEHRRAGLVTGEVSVFVGSMESRGIEPEAPGAPIS